MARILTFTLGDTEHAASPRKVDRSKLYGRTETVALDVDGQECSLVLMDADGTLIVPKGGTGLGLLADGAWVERSELVAVDAAGERLPLHPSSFDAPVPLTTPASPEDLLDCAITGVYQLDADAAFVDALGQSIFSFEYFFRAGHAGSQAFVLASGGVAYLLVGRPATFDLLGLETVAEALDEESDDDLDDLDFSMM